ncbi:MAG: hypothetical protein QM626_01050 [Microbacterium sp.]|uniref:hypothetical protein n=1 Tax=Microbacterium sp. TaxID=51671 RepID=UPI0039E71C01
MSFTTRRTAPLILVATATILAAGLSGCGSASGTDTSGRTLHIGIPIADSSSLVKAGVASPDALTADQIEQMYTIALDAISGTDAAGGYTLVPDYATFDLVDSGAPQTACAHFVQDSRDDLVLSGQFVNGGDQCVAQQGGVLLQDVAAPEAAYSIDTGTVLTLDQLPSTAAERFADYLISSGVLDGKTVGVLTDALGGDATPVTDVLVPALEDAGVEVAHVTTLTSDLQAVAQQIPTEITQMKEAGVDVIVDATPSANLMQFLGGESSAGWSAPVIASDLNYAVAETFAAAYPADLEASALTQRTFGADAGGDAASTCADRYETQGGETLVAGSTNYQTLLQACDLVTVLGKALTALGDTAFSGAAFATAVEGLGHVDGIASYGDLTFEAGTPAGVSGLQVVTWSDGGWEPTDGVWSGR